MSKSPREEALAAAKAAFGFVPNLMTAMADGNPAVAKAYLAASGALAGSVLRPAEKQAVMLAVSAHNGCHYCTAAHRTAGKSMGIDQADLDALDSETPPTDARLATLAAATREVLSERGWVDANRVGVTREELYEIVAIVGLKTITNYINHIAKTEIDPPFVAQASRSASTPK
ncbi:MAG: carboxymuconolactone decarboxylase family protein [Myxococcota bacterium]